MNLPAHKYVATTRDWQECFSVLRSEPRLAIDLEANSMHAYKERLCLIQISVPAQDYIIDPLKSLDLAGLGELIASKDVEKVFHAAEYDLSLLKREYDWELTNLFDTMWAARILGYRHYGLANLLKDLYGVKLNKRYQKSNWCRRPLSRAQRTYAQLDTHYLLRLRDQLAAEIAAAGREEEAQETFAEQCIPKVSDNSFKPQSFWSVQGAHDLEERQQAVLKAIYVYRDQEARKRDQPHFKIFNNRTLLELATLSPQSLEDLREAHGMTAGQVRRHGKQLLQVIESGLAAPPPERPKRAHRLPDDVLHRYDLLHRWRKNRAKARGVESDVIVSRDALMALANADPLTIEDLTRVDELGSWRTQAYGQEILEVLRKKSTRRHK